MTVISKKKTSKVTPAGREGPPAGTSVRRRVWGFGCGGGEKWRLQFVQADFYW